MPDDQQPQPRTINVQYSVDEIKLALAEATMEIWVLKRALLTRSDQPAPTEAAPDAGDARATG